MTRDDAIKILKNPCNSPLGLELYNEAIQTAIEALEEKPCEDTISRSQALEHIQHRLYETALNVTKKSCDDICDIYEDIAERRIVTWIKEIPETRPREFVREVKLPDGVELEFTDEIKIAKHYEKAKLVYTRDAGAILLFPNKEATEVEKIEVYEESAGFIGAYPPACKLPASDQQVKTEQEPCEDAVSRQAVDELSKALVHTTRDKADFLCNFWEGLRKLPTVQPKIAAESEG